MTERRFAIIPDYNAIDEIPRDLRFFPTEVSEPAALDSEQIEHYNREGYLLNLPVFDDAEVESLRSYFDDLLGQTLAAGNDSYSISSAHLAHARVYDLLGDDRIVSYVKDILGPDVVGWGSHFFCKMPGDGKRVSWHQDASYWPMTPSKTVTVWLAIDDADAENACMRFIPESHLAGELPFRESDPEENNVLNQTVDSIDSFPPPIDVELKAGTISMHSDLLLHGSEANQSARRRCGLTLRYCAAEVHAYMGWNAKGVCVAGRVDTNKWPGAARPV